METTRKAYLSIPETAELLGLATITVYRMAEAGRLPSVKLGSRRMVPAAKLEALLESGGVA